MPLAVRMSCPWHLRLLIGEIRTGRGESEVMGRIIRISIGFRFNPSPSRIVSGRDTLHDAHEEGFSS